MTSYLIYKANKMWNFLFSFRKYFWTGVIYGKEGKHFDEVFWESQNLNFIIENCNKRKNGRTMERVTSVPRKLLKLNLGLRKTRKILLKRQSHLRLPLVIVECHSFKGLKPELKVSNLKKIPKFHILLLNATLTATTLSNLLRFMIQWIISGS